MIRRSAGTLTVTSAEFLVGPNDAGEGVGLEHAVDVGGETHLHGVGFFVGDGLHADDGLALVGDLDAPIDALLAAGRHRDDTGHAGQAIGVSLARLVEGFEDALRYVEHHADGFLLVEVVVHVGRQHDFVFLARRTAAPAGARADLSG